MAIELTIRKKSDKNFWHYYTGFESKYSASDLLVEYPNNRALFTRLSGSFVFKREGFLPTEISIFDDTQGGTEEFFTDLILLAERLVQLGYNPYYEDGETIPSSSTFTLQGGISQGMSGSTNWYARNNINGSVYSNLVATANITDVNDFADMPWQSACHVLPTNCKLVNVYMRSNTNSASANVRCVFVKSFNSAGNKIANAQIIADKSFNTNDGVDLTGGFSVAWDASEILNNIQLNAGDEIRIFINNFGNASNMQACTYIMEFENNQ